MSQPPSDPGNLVDPDVLAERRARRAEVGEDASLELRLYEAERRLGEVAAERDALQARLDEHEQLAAAREREWAEGHPEGSEDETATLRERLAAAEAELAEVAGERDRAREALAEERTEAAAELARERAAVRSDRELRDALEAEHAVLREEIERRGRLTSQAAVAVAEARREMAASRRSGAWQARDLERRLKAERAAFAERADAVEAAVVAVREQFGAAARALRDRLASERSARAEAEEALVAERSARAEAEAQIARLEDELAQRVAAEAQLRDELEALRAELEAVRAGDDARVVDLSTRVETVQTLAAGLREDAALAGAVQAMQERVAELQAGVAAAAALRDELEVERAARWVAEAELDAERRRGDEDRAARAAAEERLAEVEAELDELRMTARPSAPDPATLASLRDALEQLRSPEPAEQAEPSMAIDLAAAAARLRSATEAALPSEPEPEADAPGPGETAQEPPARSPLPDRAPITRPGPWLRDALVALAPDEPEIAELLLVALLPAQAGQLKRPLTYELDIHGGATHRVVLDGDYARVEPPGGVPADARVAGPPAALVPLAAGAAARRLPGAHVTGRRHLRRLLKARRAPLGLADLAAAGVSPSPGLLLTVLARAVEPRWTAGRPLIVDVATEGADRWRIVASGDGPLLLLPADPEQPAAATLHAAPGRLAAVLAGLGAPGDGWIEGDTGAVRTLLGWLDRAQRGI